MNNNIKNMLRMGLMAAAGAAAMVSCSDTWDDHYKSASVTDFDGTTMQAIEEKAPAFADVIKAVGYDRELKSDNVYTIWVPTSFNKDSVMEIAKKDPDAVINRFIKNHIARYAVSENGTDQKIALMSSKFTMMTAGGKFGTAKITSSNLACKNGVIHQIDNNINYQNNIFEQIQALNNPETDSISLYSFLKVWDADSLDEDRSVSFGVDQDGNKIWVDSVVFRNNTVLKNVGALVYEEDSSYIAFIPSAKAYKERYDIAKKLLVFNPYEDVIQEGACDSLQNYYANMFALTDLFYNKNSNEHWEDSLKSTNYEKTPDWPNGIYYSKVPAYYERAIKNGWDPEKPVNDILKKGGTPIDCSNGEAYAVDEYPISVTEQFFRKIVIPTSSYNLDETMGSDGTNLYTKNVGSTQSQSGVLYDYEYQIDTIWNEAHDEYRLDRHDPVYLGYRQYSFTDIVPSSSSALPSIAFKVPGTLSGTYDLFLVTCPIWAKTGFNNGEFPEDDPRGYRFYTYIWERNDKGVYPTSPEQLYSPEPDGGPYDKYLGLSDGKYFMTDYHNKIDTLYLGAYTFQNAYYSRTQEGVLIQFQAQITSRQTKEYSREMLLSRIILKPRFEATDEKEATEAKRK